MPQTLLDDIFHVLDGPADADPALQPGHGEDVFKLGVQPVRILHDILVDLVAVLARQVIFVAAQAAGIAVDGRQRSAEIMGDGTQKTGAQSFVFRPDLGRLLFLGHALVFQGHSAFMYDGQKDGILKFRERVPFHVDADHSVTGLARIYTQIPAGTVFELRCKSAGGLTVGESPADRAQLFAQELRGESFLSCREKNRTAGSFGMI